MNTTDCSKCGATLVPTMFGPPSWRCCPNCEPKMFPVIVPAGYTLVPQRSTDSIERSERHARRLIETE